MKVRHRPKSRFMTNALRPSKGVGRGNPLTLDPTRTTLLRDAFARAFGQRFRRLALEVVDLVEREDAFGLGTGNRVGVPTPFALNANPKGCNQWTGPGCGAGSRVNDETVDKIARDFPHLKITGGRPDSPDFNQPGRAGLDAEVTRQVEKVTGRPATPFFIGKTGATGFMVDEGDHAAPLVEVAADRATGRLAVKSSSFSSGRDKKVVVGESPSFEVVRAAVKVAAGRKLSPDDREMLLAHRDSLTDNASPDQPRDSKGRFARVAGAVRAARRRAGEILRSPKTAAQAGLLSVMKVMATGKFEEVLPTAQDFSKLTWAKPDPVAAQLGLGAHDLLPVASRAMAWLYVEVRKAGRKIKGKVRFPRLPKLTFNETGWELGWEEGVELELLLDALLGPSRPTANAPGSPPDLSPEDDRIARWMAEVMGDLVGFGVGGSLLNGELNLNVFCPTGPGGGIDPTCKLSADKGGGGGGGGPEPVGSRKLRIDEIDSRGDELRAGIDAAKDKKALLPFAKAVSDWGEADLKKRSLAKAKAELKDTVDYLSGSYRQTRAIVEQNKPVEWEREDVDLSRFFTGNRSAGPTENARWSDRPTDQKLQLFRAWLASRFAATVTSQDEERLWRAYVEQGMRRGAGRSFDDVKRSQLAAPPGSVAPANDLSQQLAWYQGNREEFLQSAFTHPVQVERAKVIASRGFEDLKNVTQDAATRMTRFLSDALVQGQSPREVARTLSKELDLARGRAELIARTEVIRAHAEGQLMALERLGVEEVGVAMEFTVTKLRDGSIEKRVCPRCRAMAGVVLSLKEAAGRIPVHPRCRCAWLPANVGEPLKGQHRAKTVIDKALEKAKSEGKRIAKKRPKSKVLTNIFCPTGEGGGIDPTCGKGGKKGAISQDTPTGTKFDRSQVVDHIMAHNPPEQVKTGAMTKEEWADKFLSNEPDGYVMADVHPKALHAPLKPGVPGNVAEYSKRPADTQPPVVVDSNDKIQARFQGGKLDQAFGLQPHTIVDGKHRTEAAVLRGDKSIKAIVPVRKAKEIVAASHAIELLDFAESYAKSKGSVLLSVSQESYGPRVTARTKEGYDRSWGPSDLERIASKTGHKFRFSSPEDRP